MRGESKDSPREEIAHSPTQECRMFSSPVLHRTRVGIGITPTLSCVLLPSSLWQLLGHAEYAKLWSDTVATTAQGSRVSGGAVSAVSAALPMELQFLGS